MFDVDKDLLLEARYSLIDFLYNMKTSLKFWRIVYYDLKRVMNM